MHWTLYVAAATLCLALTPGLSSAGRMAPKVLPVLAQQADAEGDQAVSTDEFNKYIEVYRSMQHNRSLNVDKAAAAQGLTVAQFRDLEQKIERDSLLRQRARDALAESAKRKSPPPRAAPTAKP